MASGISEDRIRIFETYPIPKAIMVMSVPTVMSSLVMIIYNLADTYFVGMLNDPVQNAAVTLAAPLLLAFNAVNNLFGVGASSLMGRCLGSKEYDRAKKVVSFGFYGALACALLFSLLYTIFRGNILEILGTDTETIQATKDYLRWTVAIGAAPSILNVVLSYFIRSEGYSAAASIGTMSGCFLNIILDPIFILPWGLNLGAAGAGLATMLGNTVACVYFFVLLFRKRKTTLVSLNPKHFTLDKEIIKDVCVVGIPASIQNLLNVTGMTVLNNFSSAYGADAVAAMGISHKVSLVPLYVAMGVTQGIMPLISYNYAAKNGKRTKDVILVTAMFSCIFMIVMTAIFCVFSGQITALFIQTQSIIDYGRHFLRGMSFAMPFLAMDFLGVAVFQACGMGKTSFVFAVMRKIVLEIPALFILNKIVPLYGLAYAQLCAELVLAVAAIVVLRKIIHELPSETLGTGVNVPLEKSE